MASKMVSRVSPKLLRSCAAQQHRGYANAAAAAAQQVAPQPADRQRRGIRNDLSAVLPFGIFDIWEPVGSNRSLRQMLDTVDRFVDTAGPAAPRRPGMRPPWDIVEKPDAFYMRVDMPGLDKSELTISVEENDLLIRGERKLPEDDVFGDHRSYNTRMELPKEVERNNIKAELKNGILTIVVPKVKPEPRKVTQVQIS